MCTVTLVGMPCPEANIAPAVKPEVLDAYEAGIKADLLDRRLRLNLSGFYYDYKNLQETAIVGSPPTTLLTNAAKAQVFGGELEAIAALSSQFTINANIGVLDTKYKSFPGALVSAPRTSPPYNSASFAIDASGNELVRAPKLTSNLGFNWRIPTEIGRLEWNASWAHNSGFFWEASNRLKQPAYDLVNTQISL